MHYKKKTKLQMRRTRQKMARKTQKVDRVIMLMKVIASQKTRAISCPIQNTKTLQDEASRFTED